MTIERTVHEWLRAEAPARAPGELLRRTLDQVAVMPQQHVLWRSRRIAFRRGSSRPLLVLAATLVTMGLLGSLAILGGGPRPPSPAPAPTLGLAYGLDGDIYIANWDGTNPVRIADGDQAPRCNSFTANGGLVSPNGRYIAYRSYWSDTCPGVVYLTDVAGNLLASFAGSGWNIAWSPDSTRLATWTALGGEIGVYGLDGQRQAVLDGSLMCCGDYDPIWSPDGAASILVWSQHFVYELPLDAGPARTLPTDDPRHFARLGLAGYSPDGTRVAELGSGVLVIESVDGSKQRINLGVQEDFGSAPVPPQHVVWSPAGDRIAYIETHGLTFNAVGVPVEQRHLLRLVDPTAGSVTTLAMVVGSSRMGPLIGFSPDGQHLLFGELDEQGHKSLWTVNVDGSGARQVVDGTSEAGWLSLAADTELSMPEQTPERFPST